MVYAKKLIVLTGIGGTGSLTLEKSAAGVGGRLNTYDLPDAGRGVYVLWISGGTERIIELGEAGRMSVSLSLDATTDITAIHAAVALVSGDKVDVRLYGTLAQKKMWIGDIAERIQRKRTVKTVIASPQKPRNIEDYFLDILPTEGEFHDGAVVDVNYFDPAFAAKTEPSEQAEPAVSSTRKQPSSNPEPLTEQAPPSAEQAPSSAVEPPLQEENNAPSVSDVREEPPVSTVSDVREEPPAPPVIEVAREKAKSLRPTPADLEREYLLKLAESAAMRMSKPENTVRVPRQDGHTSVPQPQSDCFRLSSASRVKTLSYYEKKREKIDALFASCAPCPELERIMPDTRWVKVDYDGRRYYTVGLIGTRPDYLCYGVPAHYTPTAPEELAGYCNWVPLHADDPTGDGYWILFQDADTGESIDGV